MKNRLFLGLAFLALFSTSPVAASAQQWVANDLQPGSFLIFPQFNIKGDTKTRLRVTNNLDLKDVEVKINYVCPGIKHVDDFCDALDRTIRLTPHQTRIIDVDDHNPPCDEGFAVAFAQWQLNPISFNYLTGSYHINNGRRLEADNAIAVQSVQADYAVLGSGGGLRFDGTTDYAPLATELYTDFLAVASSPDVGSNLILLALDTIAGQQNPATSVFIDFWNAVEQPFSTAHEFVCWDKVRLDEIDYNFMQGNLGTVFGSMAIAAAPNCPLPGGCPPLIPYDPVIVGAIEEYAPGMRTVRNLYHDKYAKSTTYYPR